ncbi:MAG: FtsX-like permease family protein [Candidatus Nanohaloarchaea archaeon]|nr:FtsX-like permease family protein [Candidatus Nanohaloarchaea archaeon]
MNWQKYRFIWLLAKRDLLEDRTISLIVIAMLAFSFLNLAFFPAFIDGLANTFTSDLIETQIGHVSIEPDEGEFLENPDALVDKSQRLDGVVTVEERLSFTGTLRFRDESVDAQFVGTSALDSSIYASRMRQGRFLVRGDTDKVVLGQELAQEEESFGINGLGVQPGRTVTVTVDGQQREFQVKGSIGRPGASSLTRQVFVSFDTAEQLLGVNRSASAVHLIIDDRDRAGALKQQLQRLNTRGDIKTWSERSNVAGSFTQTFSIVVVVVSVVGVIIALTSIGVVIFINTNKRAREMGILRSIGAESVDVVKIFVVEALLFGLIGIALGNIFMIGIHTYLNANPIQTPVGELKTSVTASLLLTRSLWMLGAAVVAGFLPAYLLSRQGIIDTIENR